MFAQTAGATLTPVSVATVKLPRNQAITGSLSGEPETPPRSAFYHMMEKRQSMPVRTRVKA